MVEVIGSSPTAPTNTKTARNYACRFRIGGGVNGLVTRHSPDTDFPKTFKCRRSSICPRDKLLPKDSRLRETAKPLPPPCFGGTENEFRVILPVFFAIGGGVNGLVTRHSPDTDFPKTSKCRRSSICPRANFCRRTPACGKRQSPYRPRFGSTDK